MDKRIIALGGGEIKNKTTLKIDEYVSRLAHEHAGDKRPVGLFFGTASHDSMPYFNSFRKTYTSVFDIKAEVALCVYGEMNLEHIKEKLSVADFIYVGGGDTVYMINKWRECGLLQPILEAYERGVILVGLSAGAICWLENMYTDYEIMRGESNDYKVFEGLGLIKGLISPHYNERQKDFDEVIVSGGYKEAIGIENDAAIEIVNGEIVGTISSGGRAFKIINDNGELKKIEIR